MSSFSLSPSISPYRVLFAHSYETKVSPPRFRLVASRHDHDTSRHNRSDEEVVVLLLLLLLRDIRTRFDVHRCVVDSGALPRTFRRRRHRRHHPHGLFFTMLPPHTIAVIPLEYRTASSSLIAPPIVSDHCHTASLRRRPLSSSILVDLSLLHFVVYFTSNAGWLADWLVAVVPPLLLDASPITNSGTLLKQTLR